jgi:hypothetical protein
MRYLREHCGVDLITLKGRGDSGPGSLYAQTALVMVSRAGLSISQEEQVVVVLDGLHRSPHISAIGWMGKQFFLTEDRTIEARRSQAAVDPPPC